MDLHGPVPWESWSPSCLLVSVLSACGVVALAASALVSIAAAAAAAAPLVAVSAAAAPLVAAAAAAPPAAPAAAFAAAASSVAAAATPHEGVRACPAVCTVAVPLLQLMRAGKATQGTLLGGGCGERIRDQLPYPEFDLD